MTVQNKTILKFKAKDCLTALYQQTRRVADDNERAENREYRAIQNSFVLKFGAEVHAWNIYLRLLFSSHQVSLVMKASLSFIYIGGLLAFFQKETVANSIAILGENTQAKNAPAGSSTAQVPSLLAVPFRLSDVHLDPRSAYGVAQQRNLQYVSSLNDTQLACIFTSAANLTRCTAANCPSPGGNDAPLCTPLPGEMGLGWYYGHYQVCLCTPGPSLCPSSTPNHVLPAHSLPAAVVCRAPCCVGLVNVDRAGARMTVKKAGARMTVDRAGARMTVDRDGARMTVDRAGAHMTDDKAGARMAVDRAGARIVGEARVHVFRPE
ncbi:hypothetical protein CYMTET_50448 [Cymbomonas tetramitiformis]|uniref:Uncharacterized protein n=1 Tax=Cymbomonas tetramitiformis TaxID=36881 RepID=A0AAE0BN32_9CHLO|nr:hypothetical protein CYMTET_50448 [Cymbomonas tetramitiformis]